MWEKDCLQHPAFVHRLPGYANCCAAFTTTSSVFQLHASCHPGAPHDVRPESRSVTLQTLRMQGSFFFSVGVNKCNFFAVTQSVAPRPAPAAAPAPVRSVPQYKYAAGVRNPQQHMAQAQVGMPQVLSVSHRFNRKLVVEFVCNSVCLPRLRSMFRGRSL